LTYKVWFQSRPSGIFVYYSFGFPINLANFVCASQKFQSRPSGIFVYYDIAEKRLAEYGLKVFQSRPSGIFVYYANLRLADLESANLFQSRPSGIFVYYRHQWGYAGLIFIEYLLLWDHLLPSCHLWHFFYLASKFF
jgi:hypothetical protein